TQQQHDASQQWHQAQARADSIESDQKDVQSQIGDLKLQIDALDGSSSHGDVLRANQLKSDMDLRQKDLDSLNTQLGDAKTTAASYKQQTDTLSDQVKSAQADADRYGQLAANKVDQAWPLQGEATRQATSAYSDNKVDDSVLDAVNAPKTLSDIPQDDTQQTDTPQTDTPQADTPQATQPADDSGAAQTQQTGDGDQQAVAMSDGDLQRDPEAFDEASAPQAAVANVDD